MASDKATVKDIYETPGGFRKYILRKYVTRDGKIYYRIFEDSGNGKARAYIAVGSVEDLFAVMRVLDTIMLDRGKRIKKEGGDINGEE